MQVIVDLLLRRSHGALRCWRPGQGFGFALVPAVSENVSNHSGELFSQKAGEAALIQHGGQTKLLAGKLVPKHSASYSSFAFVGEAQRNSCPHRLFHSAAVLHSLQGEESLAVLTSSVDTTSEQFSANTSAMKKLVSSLEEEVRKVQLGGGSKAVERHRKKGKFLARERIDKLLDPGSPFLELSQVSFSVFRNNIRSFLRIHLFLPDYLVQ